MANVVTTQILEDGERNAIVKITGTLDTANLTNQLIVDCATLTQGGTAPRPAQVRVDHLDYSISDPLELQLMWDGNPAVPMLPACGTGAHVLLELRWLAEQRHDGKDRQHHALDDRVGVRYSDFQPRAGTREAVRFA